MSYKDHWFVRDHLGSVRAIVDITSSGTSLQNAVIEQNDYLPFGTRVPIKTSSSNLYRYNGKEEQQIAGTELAVLDYGARTYDPWLSRWTSIDPLAAKYYSTSPYVFCNNSPVNFVDFDGRIPRLYIQKSGFGHAFVTVGEGKNTIVYTYGRYGAVYETSGSTSGKYTPTGEGVLQRLSGSDAASYLNHIHKEGKFEIYQISSANDDSVSSYFDILFEQGTPPSNPEKDTYNNPNAKVINTYSLLNINCVTTSLNGININKDIIKSKAISPFKLNIDLYIQSAKDSQVIHIGNPEAFIIRTVKELNNE